MTTCTPCIANKAAGPTDTSACDEQGPGSLGGPGSRGPGLVVPAGPFLDHGREEWDATEKQLSVVGRIVDERANPVLFLQKGAGMCSPGELTDPSRCSVVRASAAKALQGFDGPPWTCLRAVLDRRRSQRLCLCHTGSNTGPAPRRLMRLSLRRSFLPRLVFSPLDVRFALVGSRQPLASLTRLECESEDSSGSEPGPDSGRTSWAGARGARLFRRH